jgi:transposase
MPPRPAAGRRRGPFRHRLQDLAAEPADGFTATVEQAALDPFRGYATRSATSYPTPSRCWTPSTSSGWAAKSSTKSAAASSKTPWAHRGYKDDPLYKIRGLLRHAVEHLSDRQSARLDACLDAGDPNLEVSLAWRCYQQLRSAYHAGPTAGRIIAEQVIESYSSCPIPEIARLGRTLKAWKQQVLAYFDTDGVSNGGTEAINLIIEKVRRLADGFRDFSHYRLRILLAAS